VRDPAGGLTGAVVRVAGVVPTVVMRVVVAVVVAVVTVVPGRGLGRRGDQGRQHTEQEAGEQGEPHGGPGGVAVRAQGRALRRDGA